MAKYSISFGGGPDKANLVLESTDAGQVKLTLADKVVVTSPDLAEEIRALLALVIADARGAVS